MLQDVTTFHKQTIWFLWQIPPELKKLFFRSVKKKSNNNKKQVYNTAYLPRCNVSF